MAFNLINKNVKIIPKWKNNDESENPIEIELKPLTTKIYWQAMEVCQKANQQKDVVSFIAMSEMSEVLKPIVTQGVISISNLTVDDKSLKPGSIVDYPALTGLVTEVLLKLIEISTISTDDKKK